MASETNENSVPIFDLSGAIQRATTRFMPAKNQVELSINAQYDRIGGVEKTPGYTQIGNTITTSTSTSTTTSSSTSTSTSTSSTTTA